MAKKDCPNHGKKVYTKNKLIICYYCNNVIMQVKPPPKKKGPHKDK